MVRFGVTFLKFGKFYTIVIWHQDSECLHPHIDGVEIRDGRLFPYCWDIGDYEIIGHGVKSYPWKLKGVLMWQFLYWESGNCFPNVVFILPIGNSTSFPTLVVVIKLKYVNILVFSHTYIDIIVCFLQQSEIKIHTYIHQSTILNTRMHINNRMYDEPTVARVKRASFKIIFSPIATTLSLSLGFNLVIEYNWH